MNLREKIERGQFVRLAEVFPPSYELNPARESILGLRQKMRDFLRRVERIQGLVDGFLVVDLKTESRVKVSAVYAAAKLKEELGVESIPVITARDANKAASRSNLVTALTSGLESIMLVWGDRYEDGAGVKNVYDYRGLSEFVSEARSIAERAEVSTTILAPVNVERLSRTEGVKIAKDRLGAGAVALLAQPPTTDDASLARHLRIMKRSGLEGRVMFNVFPFRSAEDIRICRQRFGWVLSRSLDRKAANGEAELLREAKSLAERIENSGASGLYVSTRGRPELLRYVLG